MLKVLGNKTSTTHTHSAQSKHDVPERSDVLHSHGQSGKPDLLLAEREELRVSPFCKSAPEAESCIPPTTGRFLDCAAKSGQVI